MPAFRKTLGHPAAQGITIVKLTDGARNITTTSPSVVQQIQEGDTSFNSSLSAKLKNSKGIALQELNGQTYLFRTGHQDSDYKGYLQVYDFDTLVDSNDDNNTPALVSDIVEDDVKKTGWVSPGTSKHSPSAARPMLLLHLKKLSTSPVKVQHFISPLNSTLLATHSKD